MAGPGVALRLHEFRESRDADGPTATPTKSRPGRDVRGLYPGQVARVHAVHARDCGHGLDGRRPRLLQHQIHQQSFDIRALKALALRRHGPASSAQEQRPPQTAYQEHFGLRPPLLSRS